MRERKKRLSMTAAIVALGIVTLFVISGQTGFAGVSLNSPNENTMAVSQTMSFRGSVHFGGGEVTGVHPALGSDPQELGACIWSNLSAPSVLQCSGAVPAGAVRLLLTATWLNPGHRSLVGSPILSVTGNGNTSGFEWHDGGLLNSDNNGVNWNGDAAPGLAQNYWVDNFPYASNGSTSYTLDIKNTATTCGYACNDAWAFVAELTAIPDVATNGVGMQNCGMAQNATDFGVSGLNTTYTGLGGSSCNWGNGYHPYSMYYAFNTVEMLQLNGGPSIGLPDQRGSSTCVMGKEWQVVLASSWIDKSSCPSAYANSSGYYYGWDEQLGESPDSPTQNAWWTHVLSMHSVLPPSQNDTCSVPLHVGCGYTYGQEYASLESMTTQIWPGIGSGAEYVLMEEDISVESVLPQ